MKLIDCNSNAHGVGDMNIQTVYIFGSEFTQHESAL